MTNERLLVSKKVFWTSVVLSALPVLMLFFSAAMKFVKSPEVIQGVAHLGYTEKLLIPLAIIEIACAIIYIIPPTAALGAILLTGYLGGAAATHFRIGEPMYMPIILGVMVWGGLYLRDRRVRELIPLRRPVVAAKPEQLVVAP
jgi:hypothetical protein